MGSQNNLPQKINICFQMQKKVEYGQAIYVVGNIKQLGNWEVKKSLKLFCHQESIWSNSVFIEALQSQQVIEYKYVVADWNLQNIGEVEWEIGQQNRKIQIEKNIGRIVCTNSWNKDKITVNLLVLNGQNNSQYFIFGNCWQLGSWRSLKKLKNNQEQISECYHNKLLAKEEGSFKCMSFSFQIFRGKKKICYYYLKKSNQIQIERHPGRKYQLEQGMNFHPRCLGVRHKCGNTQIYEMCNFNELTYSKINQSIYLGAYIRDFRDIQLLTSQGVTSILSIQTQQDYISHSLTQNYLRNLCHEHSINYYSFQIKDMNKEDFISKCSIPLIFMKDLIMNKAEKIYIHCSAGVYRSSQLVVLYLVLAKKLNVQEAIKLVKNKHPVARPNQTIVRDALLKISESGSVLRAFS